MRGRVLMLVLMFVFTTITIALAKVQRVIHFAGTDWYVKTGGPMGPGPNYWSDSEQSVWLDSQGRLHMTIRKISNVWYCSEVYTKQYTTYGEHRFLVEGQIDQLDKNVVLGLFVYANDQAEIDIEYAKWGDASVTKVGNYTVQPWYIQGNQHKFESPLDTTLSTHFFDWQPGYVMFGSIQGHYYGAPPSSNYYIEQWVYTGSSIPSDSQNLRTHINFWLMDGKPPTDLLNLEVIITDVVQPITLQLIDNNGAEVPQNASLIKAYPNPFNSSVQLEIKVPIKQQVEVSLFNTQGQFVRKLFQGRSAGETLRLLWDGTDAAGRSLPSGVYFSIVKTKKVKLIKKLIILR